MTKTINTHSLEKQPKASVVITILIWGFFDIYIQYFDHINQLCIMWLLSLVINTKLQCLPFKRNKNIRSRFFFFLVILSGVDLVIQFGTLFYCNGPLQCTLGQNNWLQEATFASSKSHMISHSLTISVDIPYFCEVLLNLSVIMFPTVNILFGSLFCQYSYITKI